MGGIMMFIRVVASRRANYSTECWNSLESMDLQQVPIVIPMMNIATAQGIGSFLQISLTSPPTPKVVTMKNIPSDTIDGSDINFNKMSFEVLLIDEKYQKVGDNPESKNKWKILSADECENIPELVQAKSVIITGSSSLNPGNTGQVMKGDNRFQKTSHHIAFSKSACTFYIVSGQSLLVYNETEFKKLLSATETFTARPSKVIKFQSIPDKSLLCHVSVSPSESYLVVSTNTHVSFLNVGDEVEQPFIPIIPGCLIWEGPDSFVIQSSEQLAFQGYKIAQNKLQKSATTYPKIIQEGDAFYLFDKGQKTSLSLKFSKFSCLYRCSDVLNFVICGHQIREYDFGFDSDEEAIQSEYTAVMMFFKYHNNKVEFYEVIFDEELKFPKNCTGDFNIQEIVNNTIDNGQVRPASIITICGSNLQTIKVVELCQGKITPALRMMNSDELNIYTNAQIRGCMPISFISTLNEQIMGFALNGEYYLQKRIPVLLVLNEKKNLVQYQLVDFQRDKLNLLTKDFQKYGPQLCEKPKVIVKHQNNPEPNQAIKADLTVIGGGNGTFGSGGAVTSTGNGLFGSTPSISGGGPFGTGSGPISSGPTGGGLFGTGGGLATSDRIMGLPQSNEQKPLAQLLQQVDLGSSSKPKLNNNFPTNPTWPNDQYVVVEMSEKGLESLCKPPFTVQVITSGDEVGNFQLEKGLVKDPVGLQQSDVPSANTMAYSSELQLVLIGLKHHLYTYGSMEIFKNLLESQIMPRDKIQIFKADEDPILFVLIWRELYIVASKSQLRAYNNNQENFRAVSWQLQRKNIRKIEKSFDENYLLIQDDNTFTLHQYKVGSDNQILQKVAIDAVCFYEEGLLYQTGTQLFYMTLDHSPQLFTQESPVKKISYMNQLSNKTVYMSYFSKGTIKTTFIEQIVQIDLQNMKHQPLDIPFSKDITLQDDYEFSQIDWNVQRIAFKYVEDDKILKVGYIVVVCCNLNVDYYVFNCYGNNISLIETEPETYQYIPSNNQILRGLTLLGCQFRDEKKLLVYHGGKKCEALMLPQIFYYGIDENSKSLGFYRYAIFNVNTQELMRDKSKSQPFLDKMGVKKKPSPEIQQFPPSNSISVAQTASQAGPFNTEVKSSNLGFSSKPLGQSEQSVVNFPKTTNDLFSGASDKPSLFNQPQSQQPLQPIQTPLQPPQTLKQPIQPIQTPIQPIQPVKTPIQPVQPTATSLFNQQQKNGIQNQQTQPTIAKPEPKVQPAYVLDPTGLKLQQMSEIINKSDFLKPPPVNWKEVLPRLEAQRSHLEKIYEAIQKYSVQIWKSNPEQIINARKQIEKLEQYIGVIVNSDGQRLIKERLEAKLNEINQLIEDLYTRNDYAQEFYETFYSSTNEDYSWRYSNVKNPLETLQNQKQKQSNSMLADFSGVKFNQDQQSRIDSTLFAPRKTNIAFRNVDYIQMHLNDLKEMKNRQSPSPSKKGRISFQEFLSNDKTPFKNQIKNKNKVLWDHLNQVGNHPSVVYSKMERFVPQQSIAKVQISLPPEQKQQVTVPKFTQNASEVQKQIFPSQEQQKPQAAFVQEQSNTKNDSNFEQPEARKRVAVQSKDLGDLIQDQTAQKQTQSTPSFRKLETVSSFLNIPQALNDKQKQKDEEAKNSSQEQKNQQPSLFQQPLNKPQQAGGLFGNSAPINQAATSQQGFGRMLNLDQAIKKEEEKSNPTEAKPSLPQSSEVKPVEPKPAEPRPVEPKPAEPKPPGPKPSEPKPTETKPTEPKPTEPKPFEQKPIESQPLQPQPSTLAPTAVSVPKPNTVNLQTPPQVKPPSLLPVDPKPINTADKPPQFQGLSFGSTNEPQNPPPALQAPQGGFLAFSSTPSALQSNSTATGGAFPGGGGGLFSGGGFGQSTFGASALQPTMNVAPQQISQLQFGSSSNAPATQNQQSGGGGIFGSFQNNQTSVGFGNVQVQQPAFLNQMQGANSIILNHIEGNFMKPRK